MCELVTSNQSTQFKAMLSGHHRLLRYANLKGAIASLAQHRQSD
jgi:hypothetical protein